MTTATLKTIGEPSEPWGDNRLIFINLGFEDRELAGLATNEQGLNARLRELEERLNKPAEWEFGTNKAGKATVKIPKEEGAGWQGGKGGGGGSKWQPKSPEERAEILTMNGLNAWAALNTDVGRRFEVSDVQAAMLALHRTATKIVKGSGSEQVEEASPGKGRTTPHSDPDNNVSAGVSGPANPQPALTPTSGEAGPAPEAAVDAGTPSASPDITLPEHISSEQIHYAFGGKVPAGRAAAAMFPNHSVHSLTQKQRRELLASAPDPDQEPFVYDATGAET